MSSRIPAYHRLGVEADNRFWWPDLRHWRAMENDVVHRSRWRDDGWHLTSQNCRHRVWR